MLVWRDGERVRLFTRVVPDAMRPVPLGDSLRGCAQLNISRFGSQESRTIEIWRVTKSAKSRDSFNTALNARATPNEAFQEKGAF